MDTRVTICKKYLKKTPSDNFTDLVIMYSRLQVAQVQLHKVKKGDVKRRDDACHDDFF